MKEECTVGNGVMNQTSVVMLLVDNNVLVFIPLTSLVGALSQTLHEADTVHVGDANKSQMDIDLDVDT